MRGAGGCRRCCGMPRNISSRKMNQKPDKPPCVLYTGEPYYDGLGQDKDICESNTVAASAAAKLLLWHACSRIIKLLTHTAMYTPKWYHSQSQVICVLFQHHPHWNRGYIVPLQSADTPDAVGSTILIKYRCRSRCVLAKMSIVARRMHVQF